MERTDYADLSPKTLVATYNNPATGISARRAILAELRGRGLAR